MISEDEFKQLTPEQQTIKIYELFIQNQQLKITILSNTIDKLQQEINDLNNELHHDIR